MQFVDVFSKDSIKERDKKTLLVGGVRREKKKLAPPPIWDKEKIINQIKEIKAKNEPLSPRYLRKNYYGLYQAISRHCGGGSFKEGYRKALFVAGVEPEKEHLVSIHWNKNWNKKRIVNQIKEIKARNEPLNPGYLWKNYRPLCLAIVRHFGKGSWKEGYKKALLAAGIKPEESRKYIIWDKEKIISQIKEIKGRNEPLYPQYLYKNYGHLYYAMGKYFGEGSFKEGYRKALLAAGLKPAKAPKGPRIWNKEKIINQIKEIKARNEPLHPSYLRKNYSRLYRAIWRHFGKESIEEKDKKTLLVGGVSREKKQLKRSLIWDKEKIVDQIKEIKAKNEPLSPGYLQKNYCGLSHAIGRHFGEGSLKEGYKKVFLAAGTPPEEGRKLTSWNKEKIISQIKEIKARNEPLYPSYLHKNYSGLYSAIGKYFGGGSYKEGYKKVLLVAGIPPEEGRKLASWDKEKIISQIKEIKARNEPLYPSYLYKNYRSLYSAMGKYFGEGSLKEGYRKALLAAGLKPVKALTGFRIWNKEKIINQIKGIKARNEPLYPLYLHKNYRSLYSAMGKYFGEGSFKEGYRKALLAAGLKPTKAPQGPRIWNKEKIINLIKEIKARNEPLYLQYLCKNYSSLYYAMGKYFGEGSFKEGYRKALLAAGLKPTKAPKRFRIWNKEKIISQIKEIKARNEPLYPKYLYKNYGRLYYAMGRHFGEGSCKEGYRKALLAAGLKPTKAPKRFRIWNKEKIINQIKEIKARNEPLYPTYLRKNYSRLYRAICRHFGKESIEEKDKKTLLVGEVSREKNQLKRSPIWDKEKIINQIKEIKARNEPLYPKYLRKNYGSLYYAIGKYFGGGSPKEGYRKALLAAGLKPAKGPKGPRIWNKEKIINQIKEIKARNEPLYPTYLRKNYGRLYYAIGKYFGEGSFKEGYRKALLAAGLKPAKAPQGPRIWNKEKIISLIKEIKARNEPLYPKYLCKNYGSLYYVIGKYFGEGSLKEGYRKALLAAGLEPTKASPGPRIWNKEKIISQIKEIKARNEPLYPTYLRKNYLRLYRAIWRHFGKESIEEKDKKTLLVGEVSREKKQLKRFPIWDKEKIINQIKEIKAKNEPLFPGYLRKNYYGLYHAIGRHFGGGSLKEGYRKALLAAGLKPAKAPKGPRIWNKEKIISLIKEIKARNEPLYPQYLCKNYGSLYYVMGKYFGEGSFKEGYRKALLAEGIPLEEGRKLTSWDKEKIISQIKGIKARNEPLHPTYLGKNYGSLYYAIGKYFGEGSYKEGYRKALLAAGLEPTKAPKGPRIWNKEKIISQIKEIKARNEPLYPKYLGKNYGCLYYAIGKYFGEGSFKEGYRKALLAAGLKPTKAPKGFRIWNKRKDY